MHLKNLLFPALFAGCSLSANADLFGEYKNLLIRPKGYVCYRTDQKIEIDGNLNEEVWARAPYTSSFKDIEGDLKADPHYDTKVKMVYDDDCLYIAAELKEDHIWGYLRQKDTIVYYDNDFEVFIDPDGDAHNYYEIETNVLNTIFDLFLQRPYRDGGAVIFHWDCEQLKTKSKIYGTLNDPSDTDRMWTVEMAIPQKSLRFEFRNPMVAGNYWRINFSRVEWESEYKNNRYQRATDENGKFKPEFNWVWSPQGLISMHMPERWGYLYFSPLVCGQQTEEFRYPPYENGKDLLWAFYYKQKEFYANDRKFRSNLADFGFTTPVIDFRGESWHVEIETTSRTFEIKATSPDQKQHWVINQEGHIRAI